MIVNNSQKRRDKKHRNVPHQSPRSWAEADAFVGQLAQESPEQREQWLVDEIVAVTKDYARDAAAHYAPDGRLHADKARELYEVALQGFRRFAPVQDAATLDRILGKARAQLGKEGH